MGLEGIRDAIKQINNDQTNATENNFASAEQDIEEEWIVQETQSETSEQTATITKRSKRSKRSKKHKKTCE